MAGLLMGFVLVPMLVVMLVSASRGVAQVVAAHGLERRARARSLAASTATAVAGFAGATAWQAWGGTASEDVRLATLPAIACSVAVLTAAVAELTWPRPAGAVRTASLGARRRARPSHLQRLLVLGAAGTATALVAGVLTAGPDGRSLSRSSAEFSSTASPYPGSAYAVPVGLASLLLLAVTWWAHTRVEARPALSPGHDELDRALRRTSLVRVLRPAAAGSLLTAAGLWLTLGGAVNRVTQTLRVNDVDAPRPPGDWVQNLGFAAVTAGTLFAILSFVALCWRGPGLPRHGHPGLDPVAPTSGADR